MMLPPVFPILSNDPQVVGICAKRIYRHGSAPQAVVAPYVTWFVVSGLPENSISETPRVDRYTVQIDCWSDNTGTGSQTVESLATGVRDAIEPLHHMTAVVANERDPETDRYRIGLQFDFWTERESTTDF